MSQKRAKKISQIIWMISVQIVQHDARDHWRAVIGWPTSTYSNQFGFSLPGCDWLSYIYLFKSVRLHSARLRLADLYLLIQISSAPVCRVCCHASWNEHACALHSRLLTLGSELVGMRSTHHVCRYVRKYLRKSASWNGTKKRFTVWLSLRLSDR